MDTCDSHYELAQMKDIDYTQFQSSAATDPCSSDYPPSFCSTDSVYLKLSSGVQNSSPPQIPESMLPNDITEFVLRLSQNEIDRVLRPIEDNILSSDTIFYIRDATTDISLPISGDDLLKILEENGRTPMQEQQIRNKSGKTKKLLLILLGIAIFLTISAVVVWIIIPSRDASCLSILKGSKPVIIISGGNTMRLSNSSDLIVESSNLIELYYPYDTKCSRILQVPLLIPRWGHVSGLINHSVIIAGGFNGTMCMECPDMQGTLEVEIFDLSTENIIFGPPLNKIRVPALGSSVGAGTFEGKFYICGGIAEGDPGQDPDNLGFINDCEYWELNSTKWKLTKPIDSLFIFGSLYNVTRPEVVASRAIIEQYGPKTKSWNESNLSIPSCSKKHQSAFSPFYFWNETTLLVSCFTGIDDLWECQAYMEDENSWISINGLKSGLASYTIVSFNSTTYGPAIYVFGLDYTGTVQVLSNDGCIDPQKSTKPCWSEATRVQVGRLQSSAVVIM